MSMQLHRLGRALAPLLLLTPFSALAQPAADTQQQIETHTRQAQEFVRTNHPELAAREFAAIVALDPNNLDARGNLGVLLFFQGEYAKAVPELRAVVKQRPTWKVQSLLGMAEKRTGEIAAARADLEAVFPHTEDEQVRLEVGLELIEIAYAAGDLEQAANVVGVLRRLKPADTNILYTANRIYSDLADEAMLAIAMTSPQSARMHQLMAHQMARQGNSAGAIAQCRAALKMEPKLPGLHFELAEALSTSDATVDPAEIEREYKAALEVNPFDGKSEVRLGEIAARRSDSKAAIEHYSRAVELAPNDAEANLGLAKELIAEQQPAKALPLLEHARDLDPYSSVTHYHLATLYRQLGRTEDSRRELAEFQKDKDMKSRLQEIYKEMKLEPTKQDRPDPTVGK